MMSQGIQASGHQSIGLFTKPDDLSTNAAKRDI